MSNRIYFDNAATTRMDPQVAKAMQPYFFEVFGNPSSMHRDGCEARQAMENARKVVADSVGVKPGEVIFTGSGTEADNAAIIGAFRAYDGQFFHMITDKIEHPAVLETCRFIESHGASVTYVPAGMNGMINPNDVIDSIQPDTRLISIMAANNVTGVLQPIFELAAAAHTRGILFHTDAVQAYGKINFNLPAQHIDLMSLSAHKIHGPKGVGALILREGTPFQPLLHGGGQEDGRRSSTQNMPGIIGFASAVEIGYQAMSNETARLVNLRDRLWDGIKSRVPFAYLIGDSYCRLPGHLCIGFSGFEGEAIKVLLGLDDAGISVSSGSACSAHKASEPSYVLRAMGFNPLRARGSLRIALGRFNTDEEIDHFLEIIPQVISSLTSLSTISKTGNNA